MRQDFQKLFSATGQSEPPAGLFDKMTRRWRRQRRRALAGRLTAFSLGLLGSLAAVFFAGRMVWLDFSGSGFMQFSSLLFSDASLVAVYWKNFLFSLLETLPVTGLLFLSAAVLAFLEFVKLLAKSIALAVGHKQFTN